ncbi:MAG: ABC transporter substrate-binding protein [Chloroflexia bacterium]|jgi:putative hydroxymethylpyrimidine transport system substrate-binding protein|nr:ABC transporter substrate-binding protein [Chloroflexia bacterium]
MSHHLHNLSHRTNRRAAVQGALGLAASITFAGRFTPGVLAQDPTSVSLALDWYPNANHAGLYLAQDRGYFEGANLALDIYTPADPAAALQTVGAGRDTFGISYHSEILFAREQEVPVVSVAALVQHPLNCLMMLADSDIETPSDLVGRVVGTAGLPSDDAYLQTMLEEDGASIDDVEVVNVGFDLLPAVLSGRADAVIGSYWTHETILAERQGSPVRYLRVEEWGVPDYYELIVAAGEDTIAEQGDAISVFLGALQQGYTDAIADPDAALEVLLAASPDLDAGVEREGLELLMPLWTSDGDVTFGTQTEERWDAFGSWMKEQRLLAEDVEIAAAWNGDLLPVSDASATPGATPAS